MGAEEAREVRAELLGHGLRVGRLEAPARVLEGRELLLEARLERVGVLEERGVEGVLRDARVVREDVEHVLGLVAQVVGVEDEELVPGHAAADAAVQAAEAKKTSVVLAAEADAAAVRLAAEAAADSERARSAAQRDALMLTKEALDGSSEAASRIEMLRQYTEATALLTASPNAKTVVLPRGDEWLAKLGVAMCDAPGPEP